MSYKIGDTIGQYIVLERIGQGGMATVYKANHPRLDRYVAIKMMHPALKAEDGFAERFEREAQLVASLQHPNIVSIYDFDEQDGDPYLVMNYIEGTTLKSWLKESRPTYDEIMKIVNSVGGALAFAHKKGVLHRDIKPSNIMIDHEGLIYLTDFGLARMTQAGESTMSQGVMLGTPQYISPEQAMGDRKLDYRTDIYSLGVVIHELVVGRVPFSADTPFAIVHDHIFTPLPAPKTVNELVPQPLEDFLIKVLAKKRDDRFDNVGQMLEAFHEVMAASTPEAVTQAAQGTPLSYETVAEIQKERGIESSSVPLADVGISDDLIFTSEPTKPRRKLWAAVGVIVLVVTLAISGYLTYSVILPTYQQTMQEGTEQNSLITYTGA